jgi:molybdopterin-guanine dinucleotide biosynthesis protein A
MGLLKSQPNAGIILCGGESRRMGYPKALLPFGRSTMLEHMVNLLQPLVGQLVVVASPGQYLPPLPDGVQVGRDKVAHQGPLSGMQCGLEMVQNSAETCFVTAVDTPLLHPELVAFALETLHETDVLMPWDGTYYYPLTAAYRVRPVLVKIAELVGQNRHRPLFLFQEMKSRQIGLDEIRMIDLELWSLRNINTLDDYRALMKISGNVIEPRFEKPVVQVELFGVPRLRAGVEAAVIGADRADELIAELSRQFPALHGTVVFDGQLHPAYQLVRNDSEFIRDMQTRLVSGDRLLLLDVDAGG